MSRAAREFIVARFCDERHVVDAVRAVRERGLRVFGAGLATVAAFLARSGLRPAIRARTVDMSATDDAFVVALRCRQTAFDRNLVERLLFEHGAQTVAWKVLDL